MEYTVLSSCLQFLFESNLSDERNIFFQKLVIQQNVTFYQIVPPPKKKKKKSLEPKVYI
jgi:hypothetical protein